MAYFEVIGVDYQGKMITLGGSESAGTALNQMRAANRSKMPLSSIFARRDGFSIDPDELERLAQDEPNA